MQLRQTKTSGDRIGRTGAGVLLLTAVLGLAPRACHAEEAACGPPTQRLRVAAVIDDLDLATEDGRTLKLTGIDPARGTPTRPDLGETARAVLDAWLAGRDVEVTLLSASADRWDRYPALVFASDGGAAGALSVNARLIARGWARARPEPGLGSCGADWLGFEDQARRAGLGLWADPYYAVVGANDGAGLAERGGAMVLVEGRMGFSGSQGRLSVRLGDRSGMVAHVTRGGAKSFARAGVDLKRLVGRTVRIRGFLDDRFGPRMDLSDSKQVEVLDSAGAGSATPSK